MKSESSSVTILYFLSEKDPNRETHIYPSVKYALKNCPEDVSIIALIEGKVTVPDLWLSNKRLNILPVSDSCRNFNEAILSVRDKISPGLLFLPFPGTEVLIGKETIDGFYSAHKQVEADLLLSWHYEIGDTKKIMQRVKPGYDPSNIIIPGRSNSPVWFYHGFLFVINTSHLNEKVFDPEVNFGFDYAIRMGILGTGGRIHTIPRPLYSFRRGSPFYPGKGLQETFRMEFSGDVSAHFSYTQDPARFEWGSVTFRKYLKRIGAYLPGEYFQRPAPVDAKPGKGISYIVPTYNRGHLISYAIESLLKVRQKVSRHIPIEMIIVDNGDDNTADVVSPYVKKYPEVVRYFKVSGYTLGGTRNYGVEKARNRIIGQLDSDDVLTGDPVTRIVRIFEETKAAMVVGTYYTAYRDEETGGLEIDPTPIRHDEFLVKDKNPLLQICIPGPGAPRYYSREVLLRLGGFPELSYGEDAAISDAIIKSGFRIVRDLEEPAYIAVRHANNTDSAEVNFDSVLKLNFSKYAFKLSLIEELKHIVKANPRLHKHNENIFLLNR